LYFSCKTVKICRNSRESNLQREVEKQGKFGDIGDKIFKHCQVAHTKTRAGGNLQLTRCLHGLRNFFVSINRVSKITGLEGAFKNLLNLQTITVKSITGEDSKRSDSMRQQQKSGHRFFFRAT